MVDPFGLTISLKKKKMEVDHHHVDQCETIQEHIVSTTSSSSSCWSSSGRVMPVVSFSSKVVPMAVLDGSYDVVERSCDQASESSSGLSGDIDDRLKFTEFEWKDVEERFDRLALSTSRGPEPVVKWSDFAFCIGMQQSPEFGNEVFKALRGRSRRDRKIDITKAELYGYWLRITDPSFHSRIKIFFDIWDRDMDGRIDEMDIKRGILLTASTNKLSLTQEQTQEQATLIMQVLDTKNQGYLELSQVATLLRVSIPRSSLPRRNYHSSESTIHQEEKILKAEMLFRSYWRRAWIVSLWLMVCSLLFAWKFVQYRHRTAFEVMGYCLCTAKGAAETLKLNMALILLPVCRNTITFLRRKRWMNSIIPFNDNINFHKLVAGGIVVGVILHGGTHLACDFPRISQSDRSIFRQTIASRFGYHQPSYIQILTTTEAATGISMVILMTIAFLLATKWPRRGSSHLPRSVRHVTGYNTFWYSHHLLVLVYVLLIVHSMFLFLTNNVTEKTTWMYIAFPTVLYAGERFLRAIRSGFYDVEVLKASIYPGKVLCLKLKKPEGFKYKSGMYIFIQCPQISQFQWHPFSLTSGPEDDHLSVHIRSLGDWSYQIYSLFQEAILSRVEKYPKVCIDGPYGSASQDHVKYDVIMLIGLGIGATPFISILKDIANEIHEVVYPILNSTQADYRGFRISNAPLKAYSYWVTREQSSFHWFRDIFKNIWKTSQKQPVIEMHNFLTSVYQEGDARSAWINVMQALQYAKNGIDIISGTQVQTHFGRPNWSSIFSKLATRHKGDRIGVFYCGPLALAKELERLCTTFSATTPTRFVFHKENY